jgi:hypothetical protein
MSSLSISAAWEQAKAIVGREGRLLAAVALALIVLPQVVLAVVGAPIGPDATMLSRLIYVAVVILGFVAQIALNRLAIGPSVTVGDAITVGLSRVVSLFAAIIVVLIGLMLVAVVLMTAMGAAKLITIPGPGQTPPPPLIAALIVLTALAFAIFQLIFPVAAAETGNPLRLLSRSWQLARGHYLRLLAFILVVFVGLGAVVLLIQLGVGSLVLLALGPANAGSLSALVLGLIAGTIQACFTIVTAVMLARIYVQLAGRGEPQAGVPNSGI